MKCTLNIEIGECQFPSNVLEKIGFETIKNAFVGKFRDSPLHAFKRGNNRNVVVVQACGKGKGGGEGYELLGYIIG